MVLFHPQVETETLKATFGFDKNRTIRRTFGKLPLYGIQAFTQHTNAKSQHSRRSKAKERNDAGNHFEH